jgi:plastocyanin
MKAVFVTIALASLCACGGGGGSSTGPTGHVNTPPPVDGISVNNNSFSPGTKTVAVGTNVKWAWNSCSGADPYGGTATCTEHSVTFDDGVTSPLQDQGTFNRTFTVAGPYTYHCSVHGAAMSGTITVQ